MNAQETHGWTLLHWAVRVRHVDVVRLLFKNGANVNAQTDRFGETLLHWAVKVEHVDVVRLLLENGANVNAQEKDEWTPLHWAARGGHVDVVRLLLENGANVEAKNSDGECPLAIARSTYDLKKQEKFAEFVRILRRVDIEKDLISSRCAAITSVSYGFKVASERYTSPEILIFSRP